MTKKKNNMTVIKKEDYKNFMEDNQKNSHNFNNSWATRNANGHTIYIDVLKGCSVIEKDDKEICVCDGSCKKIISHIATNII